MDDAGEGSRIRQAGQFSSWSLAAAGVTVMLAQTFHPTMFAVVRAGDTAAWLAVLLSGALTLAFALPTAVALSGQPGGLIGLARRAAGPAGAIGTGIAACAVLVLHSGLVLRETAEMTVSAVYPHTPQTFVMVALIACSLFGARGATAAQVRLGRAVVPVVLLAVLLLVGASLAWGEFPYLLPFWGPGPAGLLRGAMGITGLFAPLALFLAVAAEQVRDRARLWQAVALATGLLTLMGSLVTLVFLKAFPLPWGYSVTFPLHEMARIVVGGRYFERLDAIFVFVWFLATAVHLAVLLHTAAAVYARAFGLPAHGPTVLPVVILALTIALFPPDQGRSIAWHRVNLLPASGVALALPLALALVAAWRRRGQRRRHRHGR